jgi:hypothetical protein
METQMNRESAKFVGTAIVEAVPLLLFLVPAFLTGGWVASLLILGVPAN